MTKLYKLRFGRQNNLQEDLPCLTDIKDRFEHTYILGKTGMGKSVLMERMADYDLKQGFPVIYIDPKGESVNRLYSSCQNNPKVKYLSFKNPIKINPLRKKGYSIDTLIREFVEVMDIMITTTSFNPEATVRMKQILAKTIKGFSDKDRNLHMLNKFLTFKDDRKNYKFNNQDTSKWLAEIESTSRSGYKNASDYIGTMNSISSRLSQFLDNDEMSQFISNDNDLDIQSIVENGESLLVNTATSDSDNQKFLSALIIYSIVSYIKTTSNPKPLFVYVDEFQTCVNNSFTDILMFGRGKQVSFTLAHHDFLEVSPKVLSSILGIVNNYIVFRTGFDEAKRLANELKTKPDEIVNLEKYQAFVRLGINVSLVKTYPPNLPDISDIQISKKKEQEIQLQENVNFLGDEWISY